MKTNKDYYISDEQLNTIRHYKDMFDLESDNIEKLCNSEKDDIVYGFELGKTYINLRNCFMGMMTIYEDIKKQKLGNENK